MGAVGFPPSLADDAVVEGVTLSVDVAVVLLIIYKEAGSPQETRDKRLVSADLDGRVRQPFGPQYINRTSVVLPMLCEDKAIE